MTGGEQRFLGEILARRGVVPFERLEGLYEIQREKGGELVDLIVTAQLADEKSIAQALAAEAQVPFEGTLEPDKISTELATRIPIPFAKAHRMLVVAEDARAVHVVIADPFNTTALDDVRVLFGKSVEVAVGVGERIIDTINRVYERDAGGGELEQEDGESVDEDAASDILDSDDEAPVIRWVNSLFLHAMKERASDIHIEPEEKEVLVRYRIDGELYVARRAPRAFMNSIVSRVKIE
ncbi:MAG: ATPase, T2SS/T4P/T4SS family, partial [Polyangiaceae bacterium]